ncbi:hypothetical protein VTJ04DRAFT_3735 [Mycothermus thermophilus]|uniref:uncharacterized protein n=1 Tax=Humicola insolens TaxID=85995 RepID=UPI003742D8C1
MKPTLLLTLLTTISSTTAWRLELTTADGNRIRQFNGAASDEGKCFSINVYPAPEFGKAYFNPTPGLPAGSTKFELYRDPNCRGLAPVYKGGMGRHTFGPSVVKSFRIKKGL